MKQSSAAIAKYCVKQGVPLSEEAVRKWWRKGAPHEAAAFLEWHRARVPRDDADMKVKRLEKVTEEVRNLKLRNADLEAAAAERARNLVPRSEINEGVAKAVATVRGMLASAFVTELPPRQAGMPADQIAAMNEARLDEIMEHLYLRVEK